MSTLNYNGMTFDSAHLPDTESHLVQLVREWTNGSESFTFRTSGSTGSPKSITLTRTQLLQSIRRTQETLKLTAADHFYCCLSIETIAGAMMLFRALETGAGITLVEPLGDPLANLPEAHPYSVASFVPIQLFTLLNDSRAIYKLNGFRCVLLGGAPVSVALERALLECEASVYETYGMTETVSHVALRRIGEDVGFRPLPGIDIQLNHCGCLSIRGDITSGQWLETNDLAERRDDGTFVILGRADRAINSGGIKVHPEHVERVLEAVIPQRRYFVAGIKHPRLGEQVTLFVEGRNDENLQQHIREHLQRLPLYERPKEVHFTDRFANTPSNKIDRLSTIQSIIR